MDRKKQASTMQVITNGLLLEMGFKTKLIRKRKEKINEKNKQKYQISSRGLTVISDISPGSVNRKAKNETNTN